MSERWLPVPSWEDFYEVSDLGRVRSLPREVEQLDRWGNPCIRKLRGRIMKFYYGDAGEAYVKARASGRIEKLCVGRAVLSAFVGPPPGECDARHRGSISDNCVENLFWGDEPKGPKPKKSAPALSQKQREILTLRAVYSQRKTAKMCRVHPTVVKRLWSKRQAYMQSGSDA